ncbi:MAG: hypothetical protein ABIW46_01465 [Acidimicrobiales bacterium]
MNQTPPGAHAEDEQLSAHLDGEGETVVATHLLRCLPCRARLDDLRAVASMVRQAPPAPSADRRRSALAEAREAWDSSNPPNLVPIRPPGLSTRAPVQGETSDTAGTATRWRPPTWALGAAAAVAMMLGAVSVIVSQNGDGRDDGTNLAVAPPAGDAADAPEALSAPAGSPPTPAVGTFGPTEKQRTADGATDGGSGTDNTGDPTGAPLADLGERSDLAELVGLARRALGPSAAAGSSPVAGPPAGAAVSAVQPCAAEAAQVAGVPSAPADYVATVRYRQTPAVLHAFAAAAPGPDGSTPGRVVIMALEGCRLLDAGAL